MSESAFRPAATALHQAGGSGAESLQSASASVVIERVATVAAGMADRAGEYTRRIVESVNRKAAGTASAFVYDEAFGEVDRVHLLVHLKSMSDYEEVLAQAGMSVQQWSSAFVPGSTRDTVLLPQFWGMYNTSATGGQEKQSAVFTGTGPITGLPPAHHQTDVPVDRLLSSADSEVVIHRTGLLEYDLRSEGRQFAREVAESINSKVSEHCSVFVYEEAFGTADRLHWLIHLRSYAAYFRLLELHVRDEGVRDLYFRDLIAPEKGGGTWARLFRPGTLVDVAMTPRQWD
jgi:hypothetical protein